MLKWRRQSWTILLLLLNSPCFAFEPVVLAPDSTVPKPTQAKDAASDGHISGVSDREESTDGGGIRPTTGSARGRNQKSSLVVNDEAMNVLMKRCPLNGNINGRQISSSSKSNLMTQEFIAGPKTNGKMVPASTSNVSDSKPTLSGPNAHDTLPVATRDLDPTRGLLEGGHAEDMPSFNEWAKKRLEEQGHPSGQVVGSKGHMVKAKKNRHKNYASVDCGAKVLAANAESQSAAAVLSHDQDDYMLNPCTARTWLVLELCEAVQLERLELANFELFSSSPHNFNVFSSDHYPTRDWNFIGTFEAMDEKTAQSFSLHQTSFSKYIKVELVSHYGAEHFCPLSLVRVYGTSEYEALDTEEQTQDDQHGSSTLAVSANSADDAILASTTTIQSTNLFGSAKEAVLTIVKKAAAALSPGNKTETLLDLKKHDRLRSDILAGNCRCLQGLPDLDCKVENLSGEETACNQSIAEQSLALLACDYDNFSVILQRLRPSKNRFVTTCSHACSTYGSSNISSNLKTSKQSPSLCSFYTAVLGSLRFGALCHLDQLNLNLDSSRNFSSPTLPITHSTNSVKFTEHSEPSVLSASSPYKSSFITKSQDYVTSSACGGTSSALLQHDRRADATSLEMKIIEISDDVVVTNAKNKDIFSTKFESDILNSYNLLIQPTPSSIPCDQNAEGSKSTQTVSSCSQSQHIVSSASLLVDSRPTNDASTVLQASLDSSTSKGSSLSENESNLTLPGSSFAERASESSASIPGTESMDLKLSSSHVESREITSSSGAETALDSGQSSSSSSQLVSPPDVIYNDGQSAEVLLTLTSATFSSSPSSINGSEVKPTVLQGGIVGSVLTSGQKESVFVRLSNRIKALELNMSLSGQYLEELSRRYRKQMEEMQRAFNKTISALNETARMAHERDLKQQEVIGILQSQLDTLSKVVSTMAEQQEGLHSLVIARHLVLMMVEVVVIMALFLACFRPGLQRSSFQSLSSAVVSRISPSRTTKAIDQKVAATPVRALAGRPPERRSSDPNLAGLSPCVLLGDRRRPSSEALNVSGTYSDLLIAEPTTRTWVDRPLLPKEFDQQFKKPRRKKNRNKASHSGGGGLYRSMSIDAIASKPPVHPRVARKVSTADVTIAAGLLFDAPACSADSIEDKNCDDGFEDAVWMTKTKKKCNNSALVPPFHPPQPQLHESTNPVIVSKGSSCPLSLPLTISKPLSLKEPSLAGSAAATSIVYRNAGLAADAYDYAQRLKKVAQKIY